MAAKASCFSCKAESDQFVNGWELKDGSFAQLCKKCGFAYVNGIFCETFHMEAEGWRDCAVCGKPLHCGCIMSCNKYAPLDFGGVGCSKCLLEVDQSIASGRMTRMLKEIVATYKTDPTVSSDPTEKVVESLSPGSSQAPAPHFGEEANTDASKGDTACETKVDSETPQVDISTGNHLHPDNLPKMTNAEQLQKVSGNLNSDLIPLFEKSSTTCDANRSTGCLVIPKKYAEEHSPRDIETSPTPVDTSLKTDQEQTPRDIETGPTPVDTSVKTD
ncbi:B3 domain-containing transcription repressor VAL1-like isoform X1 [Rosa chinensis]|uniref:B3 domain-containing transcription repressor VAL1-like isoform X1 n=1 Tax=Rosa chinensis TaxID=74649 RepID=UPI000D08F5A4|nr:B3 domain-containing transcription repressor VAL1-like isoform X1 [Rosa chinensis]XP_040362277.1 B3 domain-containing transcription repressor VAL1-like isoform X1 [Rosa chinensis]XP_040362278.1 B3 domain-containing transcription repressor VAL1-like isoform X1 [Rosa chinensis]XP_040362279.1 B3 domain-containing transcription repressor VAL1-like isoform X1 [Rosa chinensis]